MRRSVAPKSWARSMAGQVFWTCGAALPQDCRLRRLARAAALGCVSRFKQPSRLFEWNDLNQRMPFKSKNNRDMHK